MVKKNLADEFEGAAKKQFLHPWLTLSVQSSHPRLFQRPAGPFQKVNGIVGQIWVICDPRQRSTENVRSSTFNITILSWKPWYALSLFIYIHIYMLCMYIYMYIYIYVYIYMSYGVLIQTVHCDPFHIPMVSITITFLVGFQGQIDKSPAPLSSSSRRNTTT